MALPSFVQHLRVLEGCGLVRSIKSGRVRTYRLVPKLLKLAEDWLSRQRNQWERQLNHRVAHVKKAMTAPLRSGPL